jgi:hypothetical protein
MDAWNGIVSLVSFAITVIPKERHGGAWKEIMGEHGGTYEGMREHKVALGSPL